MDLDRDGLDDTERALAELSALLCRALLRDGAAIDSGHHVEFACGTAAFRDKLRDALRTAVAEIPRDRLMAIAIARARVEQLENGGPVLPDDEPPSGFSSN